MAKITAKQKAFIEEYLIDLNATQAAIRAGYSEKTARNIAAENLAKPHIKVAIQEAMDRRSVRTEITSDNVLQEIAKMAFSNMMDYITITPDGFAEVDLTMLTRDQAAAIQEVTVDTLYEGSGEDKSHIKRVKFKLADKKGNLELLAKHLKLLTDKVELSPSDSLIELIKGSIQSEP